MAIPAVQLETWSHQGAIAGSRDTYATVKNVLESAAAPHASRLTKVFLQGSYCNDTNIYAESDVDVVIVCSNSFYTDLSSLSSQEKAAWRQAYDLPTYSYSEFSADVLKSLKDAFKEDVKPGTKAFSIQATNNRRKADVIAALEFRRYHKFISKYDESYDLGICFWDKNGNQINNYPKQHSDNMTKKNKDTAGWLKPMVRILKNMRSKLIADGVIKAGSAPSYYIEGLLYNVPKEQFNTSYTQCFVNALTWINNADQTKFLCANEQYYLLRDGDATSWSTNDGKAFIKAVIELWNNW